SPSCCRCVDLFSRRRSDYGSMRVTGGVIMRWVSLVVAIAGFGVAFTTASPSLMGIGFVLGCCALLALGLGLVAARIAQNAQPETTLYIDPEISALRAKTNAKAPAVAPIPRVDSDPERTA